MQTARVHSIPLTYDLRCCRLVDRLDKLTLLTKKTNIFREMKPELIFLIFVHLKCVPGENVALTSDWKIANENGCESRRPFHFALLIYTVFPRESNRSFGPSLAVGSLHGAGAGRSGWIRLEQLQ